MWFRTEFFQNHATPLSERRIRGFGALTDDIVNEAIQVLLFEWIAQFDLDRAETGQRLIDTRVLLALRV
ncbi:hypothetical protein Har1130_17505 [Haloarcula sp. CBA1130]|nr:hypothetical protein Har1130_17505 [Haloarcula sp. CBA1130]KAA9397673.1 hypothetical protein Har1129_05300 [Haloarcula sp. CBA1129]